MDQLTLGKIQSSINGRLLFRHLPISYANRLTFSHENESGYQIYNLSDNITLMIETELNKSAYIQSYTLFEDGYKIFSSNLTSELVKYITLMMNGLINIF